MYRSPHRYESERIHAASIYCSDGRMGRHFDDFLQAGLGLPRYDRVALPGGPACLAAHREAQLERDSVLRELQFLIDVHGLERIILIGHAGCAFYTNRLNLPAPMVDDHLRADLDRASRFLRRVSGIRFIESYFAHRRGDHVEFERLSAPSSSTAPAPRIVVDARSPAPSPSSASKRA